ncbi:MAG: ribbon-helix-helix protein, CopG family, partial [Gemmatimonadota bacterium]|nr:ribbon-helix-helix protein, CopG family [Gemmatimonadota bacterium]
MGKLKRFGVSIDEDLCRRFDRQMAAKGYSNRSEALRDLIRDYLVAEQWKLDGTESVASLSLVYNHHTRELSETLNNIQH